MNSEDVANALMKLVDELGSHEISTPGSNYSGEEIYSRYLMALLSNPSLAELVSIPSETIVNFIVAVIEKLELPPYGHVPYIAKLLSNPCLTKVREG